MHTAAQAGSACYAACDAYEPVFCAHNKKLLNKKLPRGQGSRAGFGAVRATKMSQTQVFPRVSMLLGRFPDPPSQAGRRAQQSNEAEYPPDSGSDPILCTFAQNGNASGPGPPPRPCCVFKVRRRAENTRESGTGSTPRPACEDPKLPRAVTPASSALLFCAHK